MTTRRIYKFFVLFLLLLTGLPTAAERLASNDLKNFVRYQPGGLQTSIVSLAGPSGQNLDLVSVVHIGDSGYYGQLNKRFTNYDAVLYELILPDEMAGQPLPGQMDTGSGLSGLQDMMARSLGLTSQLKSINYSAKNFVHADLTTSGFNQSMQDRQESMLTYLQKAMAQQGAFDSSQLDISEEEMKNLNMMALFTGTATPQEQRVFKKLMASALAASGGLMSSMNDSTLLGARNKAALDVLDKELQKGQRNLAIFYGAAHMPELQRDLQKKGWKVLSSDWLTAWKI